MGQDKLELIKGNMFRSFFQYLYPTVCVNCLKQAKNAICIDCLTLIEVTGFFCQHCGALLPQPNTCACCVNHFKSPPLIDELIIPFKYEGIISNLIKKLKFEKRLDTLKALSFLTAHPLLNIKQKQKLIALFKGLISSGDFQIIPIPVDRFRLAQRGFNQSLELAKSLSKIFFKSYPIHSNLLLKKSGFKTHSHLNKEERIQNISNAFFLNTKEPIPKNVLLIDDVFTTGATLMEASKILKKAGTEKVYAFTLAQA